MSLTSMQDLLSLIGSICLLWITGFLCWALYEIARLSKKSRELLEDTSERIASVERALGRISDTVATASQYIGVLAHAGKTIFHWTQNKPRTKK